MKRTRAALSSWRIFLVMLSVSAGLPAISLANFPSVIPPGKTETWELLTPGSSPMGSGGWYGETNLYMTVIATNYASSWTNDYPLNASNHTQVIQLDTENSAVSNLFGDTSANNEVVVDTMIQFVRSPDEDARASITNDIKIQCAYYMNTNGYPVIYLSDLNTTPAFTNLFLVLTNAFTPVASSEWARITVTMKYDDGYGNKFYQFALNGRPFTNNFGFADLVAYGVPGPWFVCANMNDMNPYLTTVNFSGTGFLDDYVVSGDATEPPVSITISINDPRGGNTIPAGIVFLQPGADTNILVVTKDYWTLDLLETNSSSITITNDLTNQIFFVNVTNAQYLDATFSADVTTLHSVPHWWLALQNADWATNDAAAEAAAVDDQDLDGVPTWLEWVAGTDADNIDSVLSITLITLDMTNFSISWPCAKPDTTLPPYVVQRSTNLLDGWVNADTVSRVAGTRSWNDPTPATSGSVFYRVAATNVTN